MKGGRCLSKKKKMREKRNRRKETYEESFPRSSNIPFYLVAAGSSVEPRRKDTPKDKARETRFSIHKIIVRPTRAEETNAIPWNMYFATYPRKKYDISRNKTTYFLLEFSSYHPGFASW